MMGGLATSVMLLATFKWLLFGVGSLLLVYIVMLYILQVQPPPTTRCSARVFYQV
jgi:hypothetical protein